MGKAELLKQLRAHVARLSRDLYASPGEAFTHVAVREYFDVDDEDALEYCDVGGGHDRGVDAFWIDDEDRRAILVLTQWTTRQKAFGADVVRAAETAYEWLRKVDGGGVSGAAPRVIDAARQLQRLRQVEPDFPVYIHVIVAGTFSEEAEAERSRAIEDLEDDPVEIVMVGLDDLLEEMEERVTREGGGARVKPVEKFTLDKRGFFVHRGQPEALVATLSGYELAKAAKKWGYRLFMRNLRFLLSVKARGSVNVGIKRTLDDPDERQHFWYYNNGIAIVCDSFKVSPGQTSVTITNMQIVNGAQTTASLQNALAQLRRDNKTQVLARIIVAPDDELQERITFYNNRQNAVKNRDLQSNDRHQDRLQRDFRKRTTPWFYERKRGEWNALTAEDPGLAQRLGKRRIDNEEAAQAAYAFYFDPGRARADKKDLFQPKKDGGYYEDIFNEKRTSASLLVPYLLAKHIRARKNDYLKQIRPIVDPRKATLDEQRLLSQLWLKFADQFILGAMAFYIERRGGFEDSRFEQLLDGDFEGMVGGMYPVAVRDLHPLFIRKEREAAPRDRQEASIGEQVFSAANYVKGNWDEALAHIQAEWDTHEAVGDALAGVPMLCLEDWRSGET
jgi:hypothetical protein